MPFHDAWGVIANDGGRVTDGLDGAVVPGLYTAGWIKRGPSGIIGTNRACAVETVTALLADRAALQTEARAGRAGLERLLDERGARAVDYDDWRRIDAAEIARGEPQGKPREKFTRREEMLAVLD